jgi:hypothetical protein
MAAIAVSEERLDIGKVLRGTAGNLGRNWWRILVLVPPLIVLPSFLSSWIAVQMTPLFPAPQTEGLWPLARYILRGWIETAIFIVPGSVASLYLCRWAAADAEGGRKSFALGDPRRLGALVLAKTAADVLISLSQLLLYAPAIVLGLVWIVISPVVVLEGARPLDSLARSAALTRTHRLRIGLILIVFYVIYFAVQLGLGAAMSDIASNVGPERYLEDLPMLSYGMFALLSTVWRLLWLACAPMLYFELVRLKSGLGGPNPAAVFD